MPTKDKTKHIFESLSPSFNFPAFQHFQQDITGHVMIKGLLVTNLGIISKLCKLDVVEQAAGCLDDVFAFLRCFLHFAC